MKSRHNSSCRSRIVLSLFDFSRIRILPENSNFPQPPRVDESSPLSDGYYFLPWPRTGNSMDSTQSNNKRGPASFILFQLPLQMAAGTGRETSHGDVSGNGSVIMRGKKKKKREEKERKKRSSRGSRLLLSRCNIRRNKPARVSFFLVWIYARHGSEREWRRKATGNGRWRCFPNGGQLIVGETEFLGESRFFIRVDGERYSISKTSNARSEENSNWEATKIEWNGKENWYLYIKVYTYIVQVFEKWSRKEDDDKKKKLGEKCSKLRDPSVITIFLQACASYAREPRHVGGVGRKIDQVDGDRLWSMDIGGRRAFPGIEW